MHINESKNGCGYPFLSRENLLTLEAKSIVFFSHLYVIDVTFIFDSAQILHNSVELIVHKPPQTNYYNLFKSYNIK